MHEESPLIGDKGLRQLPYPGVADSLPEMVPIVPSQRDARLADELFDLLITLVIVKGLILRSAFPTGAVVNQLRRRSCPILALHALKDVLQRR